MLSTHRFTVLAGMIGMVNLLWLSAGTAEMKFASEEVAATAKTPKVAEALAARKKLDEAFSAQDAEAVAALFADDLIVNSPRNQVSRKEAVLGLFKAGRMNYEAADETVEALDLRDDLVVIMGGEVIKPKAGTANPDAGKTVSRRFTDVWRKDSDGKWRLTIRQATITSVQ